MDYSDLLASEPDLWMVHWTEGKGEIEYLVPDTDTPTNDNGLRESFYDVTPYVPLFDQFLERIPRLTLDQAKKIKIDLIKQLFESKRQMQFHYPIAAGEFWWDATDGSLYASTAGGLQSTTVKVNELAAKLNALVNLINQYVADGVNTGIVPVGNATVSQVNSIVVNGVNAGLINSLNPIFANLANEINTNITYEGNMTISFINDTINAKLDASIQRTGIPVGEATTFVASPGLPSGESMPDITRVFGPVSTYSVSYIGSIAPGTFG